MADAIERRAARPDADLACDFIIARDLAQSGFREQLARGIVWPVRVLPNGVEVTFASDSWDAVVRYVEVESECCPFLDLAARRTADSVVLSVTGRTDAQEFIANIFVRADGAGCC
ncbi:MAG TPA: hypothetical protein VEZ14_06440 [Dehalococcoidia bacterium]|nr:hypothetical protein [Dehalococcoidia bacterium]